MANPILFKDDPIDPVVFDGVNHADVSLQTKRCVKFQHDPLTNPGARLYFRIDEEAEAGGTTIADFKPEGFMTAGGVEEIWIDPDASETPYLHLLLTDASGTAINGGANDRVYFLPFRHNPD